MNEDMMDYLKFMAIIISAIIAVICIFSLVYPIYSVWEQEKTGEAELKRAEWNRQITIREAEAKYQSSKQLAAAEIERAKGVAEANKIIGDSLKNNESYLRYLWITNLKNDNNQVIYIPTEAGMPILEAGRLKENGEKQ